ncbi:MAG: hypothetical protein WCP55_15390, partial [Lentisphaerota bacterium]
TDPISDELLSSGLGRTLVRVDPRYFRPTEVETLLGDAIATRDPKILLQAFYAYPIFQNSRASRLVFTELMDIFAGEYPEELHQVTELLKGTDE